MTVQRGICAEAAAAAAAEEEDDDDDERRCARSLPLSVCSSICYVTHLGVMPLPGGAVVLKRKYNTLMLSLWDFAFMDNFPRTVESDFLENCPITEISLGLIIINGSALGKDCSF